MFPWRRAVFGKDCTSIRGAWSQTSYGGVPSFHVVAVPGTGWAVIALLPDEVEALKQGKRVSKTYPVQMPLGLPPAFLEELKALKGKGATRVIKMMDTMSPPYVQPGAVLAVQSSDPPGRPPPVLLPEEMEALRAGKTLTKDALPSPPRPNPYGELRVKVVEYRQAGSDHIYTFEACDPNEDTLAGDPLGLGSHRP